MRVSQFRRPQNDVKIKNILGKTLAAGIRVREFIILADAFCTTMCRLDMTDKLSNLVHSSGAVVERTIVDPSAPKTHHPRIREE